MNLLASVLQAVGLFLVTNIDDIIVLSLFFARGAGVGGTTTAILVGQYLGFGAILAASVLVAVGATTFLPEEVIAYFGLIPLLLGAYAAWRAWRGRGEDDEQKTAGKKVAVGTVAAVTFANGGDNIGVYVPVFVTVGAPRWWPTRSSFWPWLQFWSSRRATSPPASRSPRFLSAGNTCCFRSC